MSDIVQRLRESATHARAIDRAALLNEAADEIERLRFAIRRLAEQDATLSVCDGNVTVTVDGTLTDAESLARLFHAEYERRAAEYDYKTRPDTRHFDPSSANGRLMVSVCRAVLEQLAPQPTLTDAEREAVDAAQNHIDGYDGEWGDEIAATLRGLLERTR